MVEAEVVIASSPTNPVPPLPMASPLLLVASSPPHKSVNPRLHHLALSYIGRGTRFGGRMCPCLVTFLVCSSPLVFFQLSWSFNDDIRKDEARHHYEYNFHEHSLKVTDIKAGYAW